MRVLTLSYVINFYNWNIKRIIILWQAAVKTSAAYETYWK